MRSDFQLNSFIILRASAGSGKTFKLVEQYLSICLRTAAGEKFEPLYFTRILALTFTVKAAQEMRDRVLDELDVLAKSTEQSDYFDCLAGDSPTPDQIDTLKQRAQTVHLAMLDRFADLSIMTIDAFVNRLVRGFATELSLEHDFRMEFDTDRLLGDAVGRVLKRVSATAKGDDAALTTLLRDFIDQAVEDGGSANVRSHLLKLSKSLEQEQMKVQLSDLSAWTPGQLLALRSKLRPKLYAMKRRAMGAAEELEKKLKDVRIDDGCLLDKFSGSSLKTFLAKTSSGSIAPPVPTLINQRAADCYTAKSASPRTAELAAGFNEDIGRVIQEVLNLTDSPEGVVFQTEQLIVQQIPLIASLNAISQAAVEIQDEENIRTFSGLNEMVSTTIRENPASYLFERTGERYRHIFIDEFQDTSITQWQNLSVLVAETLATNHLSLVVGDPKQAIYRWRNGDFEQLMRLPEIENPWDSVAIADAQSAMIRSENTPPMGDNWRSSPDIVNFNSVLFEAMAEELPDAYRKPYDKARQLPRKEFPGFVEVGAVIESVNEDRKRKTWAWMEQRIRRALSDGFDGRDVAVLVRKNSEATDFAEYLAGLDQPIPAFTKQSLELGKHPAPLAVVNLLTALNDPLDTGAVARFIQACGALIVARDEHWNEAALWLELQGQADIHHVLQKLLPSFDPAQLASAPLVEIVAAALHALRADEEYPSHAESMLELATTREAIDHGVSGFLEYWHRKGKEEGIHVMPDRAAVQIMTAHKSKGLEFPVVIVQALNSPPGPSSLLGISLDSERFELPCLIAEISKFKGTEGQGAYDKEVALKTFDDLNNLYVAMTRAVVRLHCVIDFTQDETLKKAVRKDGTRMPSRLAFVLQEKFNCDLTEAPFTTGKLAAALPREEGEKPPMGSLKNPEAIQYAALDFAGRPAEVKSVRPDYKAPSPGELSASALGTAVHAVLARAVTASDLQRELDRPWPWSEMSAESWAQLQSCVRAVADLQGASQWFDGSGRVMNERSLLLADGTVGRPDRVVIFDNRIEVVDYKTGTPSEAKLKKDKSQVAGYMRALQASSPEKSVHGALLYGATATVEKVTLPVD
ncbi:MAG: UvrD-helicase domain-containing protein [Flavobacteriales bacterium]|nr:UvrD-helicase domain-containing protein [Flavobacteriales bacterium]